MKISAKVKLIAIGVTAILILGGTGVIVWHYQQSAQETPNLIASQISQKVAIGSSKDLLSKSNSSNKYISTHSASQMTANQEQKEKQVEKAGASIDSMDGVSQATTESKETPAELLQRYLKITNSPEFQEEFHKVVDPLEVETYPYYDKIKELENKEKEQEHDLETASSEDQSKIQDELEKTKSKLWETRVEKTEKVILMADAIHLLHLKYFTNEEFLIIRKETARTMPRPGLYIDDKTIEMNAKLKPEAMARLKAGGWVPANPDESWY